MSNYKKVLTEEYEEILSGIDSYVKGLIRDRDGCERIIEEQKADKAHHKNSLLSHKSNIRNLRIYVREAEVKVKEATDEVASRKFKLQKINKYKSVIVSLIKKLDKLYSSQYKSGKQQQINVSKFTLLAGEDSKPQMQPLTKDLYKSLSEKLERSNVETREESVQEEMKYSEAISKLEKAITALNILKDSLEDAVANRTITFFNYIESIRQISGTKRDLRDINKELKSSCSDSSRLSKSYIKRKKISISRYDKYRR